MKIKKNNLLYFTYINKFNEQNIFQKENLKLNGRTLSLSPGLRNGETSVPSGTWNGSGIV